MPRYLSEYVCIGKSFKTGERGIVHCFPYCVENPSGPARTHKEICKSAKRAVESGKPVSTMHNFVTNLHVVTGALKEHLVKISCNVHIDQSAGRMVM